MNNFSYKFVGWILLTFGVILIPIWSYSEHVKSVVGSHAMDSGDLVAVIIGLPVFLVWSVISLKWIGKKTIKNSIVRNIVVTILALITTYLYTKFIAIHQK